MVTTSKTETKAKIKVETEIFAKTTIKTGETITTVTIETNQDKIISTKVVSIPKMSNLTHRAS